MGFAESRKDERTILVTDMKLMEAHEVEQVGKALVDAGQEGYQFIDAETLTGGHQRDPYITGFRITLRRPES